MVKTSQQDGRGFEFQLFGLSERSLHVHSKLTTGASESGRLSLC